MRTERVRTVGESANNTENQGYILPASVNKKTATKQAAVSLKILDR